MTTRPTDEEIRAMAQSLEYANWPNACDMLRAWLAERHTARDGVTDIQLEFSISFMDGWLQDEREEVLRNWNNVKSAALQSVAQPVCKLSNASLAVIGRKHFGNPISKEWYAAAKELLSRSQPQQAVPDGWWVPDEDKRECRFGDHYDNGYSNGYADGWNACREAMLSAAPAYNGKKER